MIPQSLHVYGELCNTDDTVDTAMDFELGLHIAALFAILLTSTFGNSSYDLSGNFRCPFPDRRKQSKATQNTNAGVLLC